MTACSPHIDKINEDLEKMENKLAMRSASLQLISTVLSYFSISYLYLKRNSKYLSRKIC
jgi:hypothetical protein